MSDNRHNTAPEASMKKRWVASQQTKLILLLGIIAFAVYANTLRNGFVFDDNDVIKGNAYVTKGIAGIPEILTTPYRKGLPVVVDNDHYRPWSLVSFAIEYELFELNPAPYHFFNILFFAGGVILLFLFLDKLFERKRTAVAFVAALLFALHPIHTETVANVKSRDDLLCFFFAFLSMNLFVAYLDKGKAKLLLAGVLSLFLSLMSKETAVTFLVIVPLVFFFYRNENKKRRIRITAGAALAVIVFLVIMFSVLRRYNADHFGDVAFIENPLVSAGLSFESRMATAILISGYYLRFLLFPYPLICDYSYNSIPFAHFSDAPVLLSMATYGFLIIFSAWRLIKKRKDPYAFAVLFFLINIAMYTNIPFLLAMGERFTFFSSVGFCLVGALLIVGFAGRQTSALSCLKSWKALIVLIPLLLVYTAITVSRNRDWESNYILFKTDAAKAPQNARLRYFLGYELVKTMVPKEKDPAMQRQMNEDAIDYFKQAIQIYPEFADAYANAGFVFFNLGGYDSAAYYDQAALRLRPQFADVWINLAQAFFTTRDFRRGIVVCRQAMEAVPRDARLYANISAGFGSIAVYDSTIYYAKAGIAINPEINELYQNIAFSYKITGQPDSAAKYEAIAQRKNPNFKL
jgi:protein O-mannosyl-transferase